MTTRWQPLGLGLGFLLIASVSGVGWFVIVLSSCPQEFNPSGGGSINTTGQRK